jgi:hypothetical protein
MLFFKDNILNSPPPNTQSVARRPKVAFDFAYIHSMTQAKWIIFEVLQMGINPVGETIIHFVQRFSGRAKDLQRK